MVKVVFPSIIMSATNGEREVEVTASTLGEVLDKLAAKYGETFRERILDPDGRPKRLLNFYVNGRNIRFLDQLNTRVGEGDEVTVLPTVSGG